MSGRDLSLLGFGLESVHESLGQTDKACVHFPIPRRFLNYFISLIEGFKLEHAEVRNALDVYTQISIASRRSPKRLDYAPLFYAAVRLSVFWRRRRDILTQHHDFVQQVLGSCNLTTQAIVDAECEILSLLACDVWSRSHNPCEIIDLLVPRGSMQIVNELAHDVCMISSTNSFGSSYTSLQIGAACVVTAVLVATKSRDSSGVSCRIVRCQDSNTIEKLSNLMLLSILSN